LTPIDRLPSADGPIESVAALTNAVHANAATARLEAFIGFLLWVRAATINDSPDHPIDLDQGSGNKKPREGYPAGLLPIASIEGWAAWKQQWPR
jgi:hypothetical protein